MKQQLKPFSEGGCPASGPLIRAAAILESHFTNESICVTMALTMGSVTMQGRLAAPARSSVPVAAVLPAQPMRSVRLGTSGKSLGCVAQPLCEQRRSLVLRAGRSAPAIVAMAAEKGYKASFR